MNEWGNFKGARHKKAKNSWSQTLVVFIYDDILFFPQTLAAATVVSSTSKNERATEFKISVVNGVTTKTM